jgi:protoporphyrinogen oxidase
LNDLVGLLSNPKSGEFPLQSRPSAKIQQKLSYLNTAFFNLMVRESEVNLKKTAQWIYISGSKYKISRVTCMREFHNSTTPEGYYNLIAEVTSLDPKSQVITAPENLIPNVIDDLKSVGIVKRSAVFAKDSIRVEPVFDTYPIYDTNYKEKFTDAIKHIKSVSPHIDLLGRSGAFWYNNSDHSIRMAIEYVRRQVDKKHPEFLYREYFGGQPGH